MKCHMVNHHQETAAVTAEADAEASGVLGGIDADADAEASGVFGGIDAE